MLSAGSGVNQRAKPGVGNGAILYGQMTRYRFKRPPAIKDLIQEKSRKVSRELR